MIRTTVAKPNNSYPAQRCLLQPNRFLLIAEGFAVAFHMLPLEIADLFQKANDPVLVHGGITR
jgi:hypothetical protein